MTPLTGVRLITLAVNLPGPVAAARFQELGAEVTKVEPPGGDPLAQVCPSLYRELAVGQRILTLDLKVPAQRAELDPLLAQADLLLTSSRPAALERLGLGWPTLHERFPQLCQVAIVGHPPPEDNRPGHDLTYAAQQGLLQPPALPPTLIADLGGAEQAVSGGLALLLARARGGDAGRALVPLAAAAETFALPLRHGLTQPGGILGGGLPGYNLYPTADGWIALAALEPHFWRRLLLGLGLETATQQELAARFRTRPGTHWAAWARERDIPLAIVQQTIVQ